MTKHLCWYHVCNDFSLELVDVNGPEWETLKEEVVDMTLVLQDGNFHGYGYDEDEGPIYAVAPVGADYYFPGRY